MGFIILMLGFFFSLKFYFWEPSNFTQYSLPYYLKINDEVKRFPVFNSKNEPKYRVYSADGLTPAGVEVGYETELSLPFLLRELKQRSFSCMKEANTFYLCEKRHNKQLISFLIMQATPLKLTVTFQRL